MVNSCSTLQNYKSLAKHSGLSIPFSPKVQKIPRHFIFFKIAYLQSETKIYISEKWKVSINSVQITCVTLYTYTKPAESLCFAEPYNNNIYIADSMSKKEHQNRVQKTIMKIKNYKINLK